MNPTDTQARNENVWDADVAGALAASDQILLFETDEFLRVTRAGTAMQALLGPACVGVVLPSRIHPEDLMRVLARIQVADDDGLVEARAEFRLRTQDGTYRWVHVVFRARPGTASAARTLVGCGVDVTERVVTERVRHRNAMRMQSLLETTEDAIFYVEPGLDPGIIVFVNERINSILGYAPDDFAADSRLWRRVVPSSEWRTVWKAIRGVLEGESQTLTLTMARRDGEQIQVSVALRALHDTSGRVVRLLGAMRPESISTAHADPRLVRAQPIQMS